MIYLSNNEPDLICNILLSVKPRYMIGHKEQYIKDIIFWRDFRHKVLELYNIPFSVYTKRMKKIKSYFK